MEMLSKNAKVRLPFYVQETVKDVRRKCILINKRKLTHQLAVSGHSSDRTTYTVLNRDVSHKSTSYGNDLLIVAIAY